MKTIKQEIHKMLQEIKNIVTKSIGCVILESNNILMEDMGFNASIDITTCG